MQITSPNQRMIMKRTALLAYAEKTYGTEPDFPWRGTYDYAVLRHKGSRKWYGLLMTLTADKLGQKGNSTIDVINLKARPEHIGSLRMKPGIFAAYHMNKNHWITVSLESELSDEEIFGLLDESFALTK